MSQSNGRYDVHCSLAVATSLRDIQEAANPTDRKRIASTFRTILRKLAINPHHLGEPLYRLPELRMRVRIVAIAPLVITFAVSEERPEVYIKSGCRM